MHNTHIHTDHPPISPAWTMYIIYSNSQGTITSADTGSLVPTEFTANALKVTLSPLVKFTLSWLTSSETCICSELGNVWFIPFTSTCTNEVYNTCQMVCTFSQHLRKYMYSYYTFIHFLLTHVNNRKRGSMHSTQPCLTELFLKMTGDLWWASLLWRSFSYSYHFSPNPQSDGSAVI